MVSGIRNTGFQITGIKVSLDKNIHIGRITASNWVVKNEFAKNY